jgi:hypothetical protein
MEGPRTLKLDSICEGAAGELFENALEAVLANIDDANADAKATRRIVLTISFKPSDEDRRSALTAVSCVTKLAGVKPVGTVVAIGRHEGKLAAVEMAPQEELFPKPTGRPVAVNDTPGTED